MSENIDDETLSEWLSDLDYAKRKFGKGHSYPSAQERLGDVINSMQATDTSEVDTDLLEKWHQGLDYVHRKFSKGFDFPSAQDRVRDVRNDIEGHIE